MKENKYDDPDFFKQYSQMERSVKGLNGAGEWHTLKKMLPDFQNKRVLDLGCGFGWHCIYAVEQGAKSVVGIDISEKMLEKAKEINNSPKIEYKRMAIEDINFPDDSFDIVFSSLAFHYLKSFEDICYKINKCLSINGTFVFSVEHPIFTAYGSQDWYYNEREERLHWPVDNYFNEGERKAVFLGETVVKYHRTITSYINNLLNQGFKIIQLVEPEPDESFLRSIPEMKDELRRPMFLIIATEKYKNL